MLRQFAGLWILFFGAIALSQYFRSQNASVAIVIGAFALVVGVPGLFFPRVLKPIFVGWMILAFPIGWLVSHVILFLIYWSVFVPIGLYCDEWGMIRCDCGSHRATATGNKRLSKPVCGAI